MPNCPSFMSPRILPQKPHRPESSDSPVLTGGVGTSRGGRGGEGGTPTKAPADWSANPAGSSRPAGAEQTQSPCNGCGKQEILVKAQEEETQQALNCGPILVLT